MANFVNQSFFKRFSKTNNLHYDWILLTVVIFLTTGGLAFLASGLSVSSPGIYRSEFQKQLLYGVWIGGVLAFIAAKLDYHVWFKYSKLLLWITFALLAFLGIFSLYSVSMPDVSYAQAANIARSWPIRPYEANGSIRWIRITGLTNFQPVELAKLTILVYFAAVIQKYSSGTITWQNLKKPLYVFALAAFLILVQPDLGSVALIFSILLGAMWVSKISLKILAPSTVLVVVVSIVLIFATPFRRGRVEAFLSTDTARAFQVNQVRQAVANGGMWGKGYGNSEYKQAKAIPELTTDAIIALIGEEMGFFFTVSFLGLYLILLMRSIKIAKEAPDTGGAALATGIGVWIVAQAFLNITSWTGVIPPKGVPLPFISAGGSSIILNLLAIGILLNVSNQSIKNIPTIPKPNIFKTKISKVIK